jgi:glycine cleavage system H protein
LRKGTPLALGQGFGTVESLKWVERLSSPVAGILEETNESLRSHPDLINRDPYGEGWLVRIRLEGSPEEYLSKLTHAPEIEDWVRKELVKYGEQLKQKRG